MSLSNEIVPLWQGEMQTFCNPAVMYWLQVAHNGDSLWPLTVFLNKINISFSMKKYTGKNYVFISTNLRSRCVSFMFLNLVAKVHFFLRLVSLEIRMLFERNDGRLSIIHVVRRGFISHYWRKYRCYFGQETFIWM